ncbi:putative disease resistance protein [Vitis vinifera]|uniref:Putative disease resistance protein n=1 Tax=Vitis vinifera TaxID=29760 RepID=A0A438DF43_VITVI|nr:putative disease resistance protein [Vitis vinifera]
MDGMKSVEIIPQDLISSLISLKLFSLYESNITSGVEETVLEELESLNDISEIRITICNALSFNKLKSSRKLQRMEHLNALYVSHCDKLKEVKINVERQGIHNDMTLPNKIAAREEYFHTLRVVFVEHCSKLLDLTWLVYAPYLERLYVEDCELIEEVIRDDSEVCEIKEKLDIFSRLKSLKLNRLPRLKNIYQHPLLFPSLEIIKVYECKGLRSLPFDSNTSNNSLKKIKGETSWWNQLKWNNETCKHSFTPYFQIHEAEAYSTDTEESETGSIDDVQEQPGLVLPLLTQLGSELLWLLPFVLLFFLLIGIDVSWIMFACWSEFLICLWRCADSQSIAIHGAQSAGKAGFVFFVGPVEYGGSEAASNLSVVCRRWNLHGGCSVHIPECILPRVIYPTAKCVVHDVM